MLISTHQVWIFLLGLISIALVYFADYPGSLSLVSATVYVKKSCVATQCSRSQVDGPCCSNLKSAVNLVESYETIYISPGNYTGKLNTGLCGTLRNCTFSGVSLIGTFYTGVYITGSASDSTIRALHIRDSSFTLLANVTYRNFQLTSPAPSTSTLPSTGQSGGAIYIENSTVTMKNVKFLDNFSLYGGAVSITRGSLTIEDSHFQANQVSTSGGALAVLDSNLTVSRTVFEGNNASSINNDLSTIGGAIGYIGNPNDFLVIDRCIFRRNGAQHAGGAIAIEPQSFSVGPSYVHIANSEFTENSANGEGTCVSTSSCNTIGGAVYVNAANVTFEKNKFSQNNVRTLSSTNLGEGGALFIANLLGTVHRDGTTRIMGCNFTQNYAIGSGGAVQVLNQHFTISDSLFYENKVYTMSTYFDNTPSAGGAIWFSAQGLSGDIRSCDFINNTAFSGWGGGIFVTGSTSLNVIESRFRANGAISSYTNSGQGGGIMASSGTSLTIEKCVFLLNSAMPKVRVSPQTYSGEGGAIFAQSSKLFVHHTLFSSNYAITGQFDAGAAGGAILLEDCYPSVFRNNIFRANGAVGYLGRSSYASCGTGGGLYIKFSAADISECEFSQNWVSAGGSQNSIGGAVASKKPFIVFQVLHNNTNSLSVNFDYSSVSGQYYGVSINDTVFHNNSAFSQVCFYSQSGQGAAIGIIGAADPPVQFNRVNFTYNRAQSTQSAAVVSAGGAFTMSQQSNVSASDCFFSKNAAYFGIGDDIASVAGENMKENFLYVANSRFEASSLKELDSSYSELVHMGQQICSQVQLCVDGEGPLCNAIVVGGGESRRLEAPPTQFSSIKGMDWLYLLDNGENYILELFESYEIPIPKPQYEEDKLILSNVITALEEFVLVSTDLTDLELELTNLVLAEVKFVLHEEFVEERPFLERKIDLVQPYSQQQSSLMPTNRRLEFSPPGNEDLDFLTFRPDIVITSGLAILYSPIFEGPYYIFCGDYASISSFKSMNSYTVDTTTSGFYSELTLTGSIEASELTLTILHSTVNFDMPMMTSNAMAIKQVNIFNGTLRIANNIDVLEASYLYESTIVGIANQHMSMYKLPYPVHIPRRSGKGSAYSASNTSVEVVNANITFFDEVFTGYELEQLSGHKDFAKKTIIVERINGTMNGTSTETIITFENCAVVVQGKMYLDSPFRSVFYNHTKPSTHDLSNAQYLPNTRVVLTKNATLIVNHGGTLALLTTSIVEADNDMFPAVINYGNVSLMGTTGYVFWDETKLPTPKRGAALAALGSLTSILTVQGEMLQYNTGVINVILNSSHQALPVVNLQSNLYMSGSLAVSFFTNAELFDDDSLATIVYPNLELYTDPVSAFEVIRYRNFSKPEVSNPLSVSAPQGLAFTSEVFESLDSDNSNDIDGMYYEAAAVGNKTHASYVQKITLHNIGCDLIFEYYANVEKKAKNDASSFYPCHICLSNSSCELCGDGSCSVKGMCTTGVSYSGTCCTPECEMPYGSCEPNGDDTGSDDYNSYGCSCTWFYTGATCHDLSTYGIITIFSGIFVIVTAILTLFIYRRAVQQKNKVLEELKEGILRHTESGNNEYIQTMQQALILNDVFVKYDEIKLETQIGEGSFGVVHKATFRGAQVAVKQMRSMFLELTEKDIDEFRKEAYMMSRLRHPNIVLVMGISLVDQEPIPLPKSRSMLMAPSNDRDNSTLLSSDKKKATKPQKTVCIITEYLEQGSLADILYGPTRLPADIWTYELILTCALQASRGMLYLHSHHPPICHRDLKSSNLVVDDHWVVKVTDFGMSRIVPEKVQEQEKGLAEEDEPLIGRDSMADGSEGSVMVPVNGSGNGGKSSNGTANVSGARLSISALSNQNPVALEMTSNLGTTAWCAPELLTASSRTRYSVKVDVYSFGMVLWELWEKKRPFEEFTSRFDIMDAVRAGKRPIISENCPPTFKSLITRCWHSEPSRRPTFNYIVRYLKDELARVKRNKAMNMQNAVGNGGNGGLGGQTNRSSLMSNYFRPSFSQVHQNASTKSMDQHGSGANHGSGNMGGGSGRGSSQSVEDIASQTKKTRRSSGSSIQSSAAMNPMFNNDIVKEPTPSATPAATVKQKEETPSGSFSASAPVPIRGSMSDANLPEGRTPLVKAFDRSLSYLTESPSMNSPIQQQNFQKYSANQAWRDRYVMKFSGWNSSNPDNGLPPSRQTVSSMTPEIPVPGARFAQRGIPSSPSKVSSSAGSVTTANDNNASSYSRTQEARSPPGSIDSQPIFSLDQDRSSSTMAQARKGITELADEVRAENNSL